MNNIYYIIYKNNYLIIYNVKNKNIEFFDFNENEQALLLKLNNLINNKDIILTYNIPIFMYCIKNRVNHIFNDEYNYLNPIYKHSFEELINKFTKNYRSNQENQILFLDLNILQNVLNIESLLKNDSDYEFLMSILKDSLNIQEIKNIILFLSTNNYEEIDKIENKCILHYRNKNIDYFNYKESE